MLCAGVAGWYLANSQRMPVLSLLACRGTCWAVVVRSAPKDAGVVQLRARICLELPKTRLTLHAGRMAGPEQ